MSSTLTDEEQLVRLLPAMRTAFKDVDGHGLRMDDRTYSRYLKARKFDLEKAQEMLHATITWRETFGLTDMHDGWMSQVAEENSTGKVYVRGFDKQGHALIYLRPRQENTNNHDGNLRHLVYNMERAIHVMEKRGQVQENEGKVQEKYTLVIDYEGYSLLNAPPMKTSQETLAILQNHYPERLHKAYCVYPPWIMHGFWVMITPFIDPITYQKINMVSGTVREVGERLSSDIDLSQLEACVGGSDERPFNSPLYLGRGAAAASSSSTSAATAPAAEAEGSAAASSSSASSASSSLFPSVFGFDYLSLIPEGGASITASSKEAGKGWLW